MSFVTRAARMRLPSALACHRARRSPWPFQVRRYVPLAVPLFVTVSLGRHVGDDAQLVGDRRQAVADVVGGQTLELATRAGREVHRLGA